MHIFSAILFDFHNTLVTCDAWLDLEINTLPSLAIELLARKGVLSHVAPSDYERARTLFRELRQRARTSGVEVSAVDGVRDVLRQMGYEPPLREIEAAVAELEEACVPSAAPVPGALDTLRQLHSAGYRMAVVSSAGWPQFVEDALIREGMRPFFQHVLTSAGEGIYKSDPEIFRRACARLRVEPSRAIHVGDHAVYDVKTAGEAGLHTIWFDANAQHTAQLHQHDWEALQRQGNEADAVVHDLREIPGALETMSRKSRRNI